MWSAPGKVGEPKIGGLLETGARVHVVALEASEAVQEWARAGKIALEIRGFAPGGSRRNVPRVVATASRDLNEFDLSRSATRVEFCAMWSTFRSIATSTIPRSCGAAICRLRSRRIGQSPSLAQKLRQQLERQFGPGYAQWVAELGETRRLVLASDLDPERKRDLLHSLASREALKAALEEESAKREEDKEGNSMNGKVYLVGAGPGDPELLTVKALRLLQTADVVFHDDLVSPEILKLISPSAEVQNVGKRCGSKTIRQEEINFLLVARAASGLQVVRLKSGDPLIFGRAGEEIEALRRSRIAVRDCSRRYLCLRRGCRSWNPTDPSAGVFDHSADGRASSVAEPSIGERRWRLEPLCRGRVDACRLHAGLGLRRDFQTARLRRIRGTNSVRNYFPGDHSTATNLLHDSF